MNQGIPIRSPNPQPLPIGEFPRIASMRATAATAAATTAATALLRLVDVLLGRHPAELHRQIHVFGDLPLQGFQLVLSIQKGRGYLILHQLVPSSFELLNLGRRQANARMLFLVQFFAPLMHRLIHLAGAIVAQEALHILLELEEAGIRRDHRAQFAGLIQNGGSLS